MRRRKTKNRDKGSSDEDDDRLNDSSVSKEIKTALSQILRIAEDEDDSNWSLYSIQDGKKIYLCIDTRGRTSTSSDNKTLSFKSSVIIHGEMEEISDYLSNPKKRKQWDPLLYQAKEVSRMSSKLSTLYLGYLSFDWWVWPRDYLFVQYLHKRKNLQAIVYHSLNDPNIYPATWNYVRAEISGGGFLIQKIDSDDGIPLCKVTYLCTMNLKGFLQWAPTHFISHIFTQRMNALSAIQISTEEILGFSVKKINKVAKHAESESPVIENKEGKEEIPHAEKEDTKTQPEQEEEESESEDEEESPELQTTRKFFENLKNSRESLPPQIAEEVDKNINQLLQLYEDKSWEKQTEKENVSIFKKEVPGASGITCTRGDGDVMAPPEAILEMLRQTDRRSEWDKMFKEGQVIETFNDYTGVSKMSYNTIWPVTARDFCSLLHMRLLENGIYIVTAKNFKHPKCPDTKGFVRGEVMIAGFIMKKNENRGTKLTYITQVDLKGNVPTPLMNMAATQQPLCVSGVRKVVENSDISKFDYLKKPPKVKKPKKVISEIPKPPNSDSNYRGMEPPENKKEERSEDLKLQLSSSGDIHPFKPVPVHAASTGSLIERKSNSLTSEDKLKITNLTQSEKPSSLRNSIDSEPKITTSIPNQIESPEQLKARIMPIIKESISGLEEAVNTHDYTWKTVGVKDDVLIMKKEPKDGVLYAFKGIGEINAPPEQVKDTIKNVNNSKDWDVLFKEGRIITVVDENTEVIQLLYQTRMCLLKTARDFCICYHTVKKADGSYLLAGKSIETPNCPPEKGFTRGEVLASGFVIQPKGGDPKSSIVTYLTQVDLKGIPSSIINIISERQPLVIAGVRKFITGSRTLPLK